MQNWPCGLCTRQKFNSLLATSWRHTLDTQEYNDLEISNTNLEEANSESKNDWLLPRPMRVQGVTHFAFLSVAFFGQLSSFELLAFLQCAQHNFSPRVQTLI